MSTKIWYDKYKIGYDNVDNQWMRALPLGNGRVAAMVFGNPDCEVIEINEESMWSGKQVEEKFNLTPEKLEEIRALVRDGRFDKAEEECKEYMLSDPICVRFYETFGELLVDYYDKTPVKNYYRELELSTAVSLVKFDKNNVHYEAETFISAEYDALVHRITTSSPASYKITIKRDKDAFTAVVSEKAILMKGQIHYFESPRHGAAGEGLSFSARLYVDTDGETVVNDSCVDVVNASYVTIYGAFATNYNVKTYSIDESIDCRLKLDDTIDRVKNVPYDKVKEKHISDWQEKFNQASFKLDVDPPKGIPTDFRLEQLRYLSANDPDIFSLYFNFGRYLLLSASGFNATLPANLQGKWVHGFRPTWGSDYHLNINLQMNYWPCEIANMPQTFSPFTHMIKMLSKFGVRTAREMFGAKGWVHMHTTDIYGKTGVHDSARCGFFPVAGPWNCLNLWEHYEFSGDESYLNEIYPIMKGACEFFADFLIEKDGYLVTSPSNSPENEYYYTHPDTGEIKRTMLTEGSTIDLQIIHSLFTRTLIAADKLGETEEFISVLKNVLSKLPPLRVSQYGTVAEWREDYEEVEPGHRHMSHLFGLFPSDQINELDPVIYEAAKKTIARRLANGGGGTGWSCAWITNFYARLHDGENAYKTLDKLVKEFTYYNMFDLHPPRPLFQIDGNFGGLAGICEMLLQSHLGEVGSRIIDVLPALPNEWNKGEVKGLRARGNFTVDIKWNDGKAELVRVKAEKNSTLRIKLSPQTEDLKLPSNAVIEGNVIVLNLTKGEVVEFAK